MAHPLTETSTRRRSSHATEFLSSEIEFVGMKGMMRHWPGEETLQSRNLPWGEFELTSDSAVEKAVLITGGKSSSRNVHSSQSNGSIGLVKKGKGGPAGLCFAVCLCVFLVYRSGTDSPKLSSSWEWDRNHYEVVSADTPSEKDNYHSLFLEGNIENEPSGYSPNIDERPSKRNVLIAQMTGPGPLREITNVSSRPNRAYAKHWGYDYLRFTGLPIGYLPWHATFNKIFVLHALQESKWRRDNIMPVYTTVVLLDADDVFVDLDHDILDLIPEDKLVATTGVGQENVPVNCGVSIWNLDNPHVGRVSNLWMEHAKRSLSDETDDAQSILRSILQMDIAGEKSRQLVHPIQSTSAGFLGGKAIKFVDPDTSLPKTKWLIDNPAEAIVMLQQVADSVCYRYYPRCEVL